MYDTFIVLNYACKNLCVSHHISVTSHVHAQLFAVMVVHIVRMSRLRACISMSHIRFSSTQADPAPNPGARGHMSAWQIHQYGGNEELALSSTVRMPTLRSPEDILIQVHAASVNPIDVRMRGK